MDERRKTIKDLELLKQETLRLSSRLLEELGESLLFTTAVSFGPEGLDSPTSASTPFAGAYQRLLNEAKDAGEAIKAIEEDTRRLKQAKDTLAFKKETAAAISQNQDRLFALLGERLIDAPGELTGPYKRQLDALGDKIKATEDQLGELQVQGPSNIFTRLGRDAKSRFYRSTLEKNHAGARRIYEALGKRIASLDPAQSGIEAEGPAAELLAELGTVQQQLTALHEDSARLQEEQRRLTAALNVQGGPSRRIGALEKQIDRVKQEIRLLFKQCGEAAADPAGAFERPLEEPDLSILQKIRETRQAQEDLERRIERLKADLAIDEERAAIAKMEKTIQSHRLRISEAEAAIRDLEERTRKAQEHIEELKTTEAHVPAN